MAYCVLAESGLSEGSPLGLSGELMRGLVSLRVVEDMMTMLILLKLMSCKLGFEVWMYGDILLHYSAPLHGYIYMP